MGMNWYTYIFLQKKRICVRCTSESVLLRKSVSHSSYFHAVAFCTGTHAAGSAAKNWTSELVNHWKLNFTCLFVLPLIATLWPLSYELLIAALSTSDRYLISFWSLPYQPLIATVWPLPYELLIAALSTHDRYLISFWSLPYQPLIATLSTSDRYLLTSILWASDGYL